MMPIRIFKRRKIVIHYVPISSIDHFNRMYQIQIVIQRTLQSEHFSVNEHIKSEVLNPSQCHVRLPLLSGDNIWSQRIYFKYIHLHLL